MAFNTEMGPAVGIGQPVLEPSAGSGGAAPEKRSRIFLHNLYAYAIQIVTFVFLLVYNLWLPRELGAYLYGILAINMSLVALTIAPFDEGANLQGVTLGRLAQDAREPAKRSELAALLGFKAVLSLLASLILAAILFPLGPYLRLQSPSDLGLIYYAVLLLPFYSLNALLIAVLTGALRLQVAFGGSFLVGGLLVSLPIFFFKALHSRSLVALSPVLAYAVACLFFGTEVAKHLHLRGVWSEAHQFLRKHLKTFLSHSVRYATGGIYLAVLNWGIVVAFGFTRSVEEGAYFKIAVAIILGLAAFIPAPRYAVYASFLETQSGDAETARVRNYFDRLLKYGGAITILGMVGALCFGPTVVRLLYGHKFQSAGSYVQILALALPLTHWVNCLSAYGWARQRIQAVSNCFLAAAAIAGVSAFLMGRWVQGAWVGLAYVLGPLTMVLGMTAVLGFEIMSRVLHAYARPFAAGLFAGLAVYLLRGLSAALCWQLALVPLSCGVYAGALKVLGWFEHEEMKALVATFRRARDLG
jgi:O-antigen/teichoic acid export membrane protein